ncbi:MAG: alpha/beta fold hydrolase [Solirubrobacteraceae bacterium]
MAPRELTLAGADGTLLAGEESGEGQPIVLLHGLTATRRYVVMGSRLLERSAHRVIAYDARGHGRSQAAPSPDAYTYALLGEDLECVLDELGIERAVIAGASMGAHTALRFAMAHPRRVVALGVITPAYAREASPGEHAGWDALARCLRARGVEGFMAAYDLSKVPLEWRGTVEKVIRQRLSSHEHLDAVADALQAVPRSQPFERFGDLEQIAIPTLVVGSRDQADPDHPLAVAERYAKAIPGARLVVEEPGPPLHSPIAWQGGRLSKVLAQLAS